MIERLAARLSSGVLIGGLALFPLQSHADDGVGEIQGYRLDDYRSAVPATLAGARVIDTGEAEKLWKEKAAVFIDVLPRPPKPKLPEGTIYREKLRYTIPGSIWLVDVGYGALPPEMEIYFKDGLKRVTAGDAARSVVFFCLSNCWMSWNAAKRAMHYGYSNVIWYPEGTDGWADAELPVEEKQPEPRPGDNP